LGYLRKTDSEAARRASERYACFDQFGNDSQVYGLLTGLSSAEDCEEEAIAMLVDLRRRASSTVRDGHDDSAFDAEQNARLVKNAEAYYRSMYLSDVSSWSLRDRHMVETLHALERHLGRSGNRPKIVVWAHNSHLGDARATRRTAGAQCRMARHRSAGNLSCGLVAMDTLAPGIDHRPLRIPAGWVTIDADLNLPTDTRGIVLFAHGSGSSRFSPRNRFVARKLGEAGLATVLADLLTSEEEEIDERTRHLRFDIELLAQRLVAATDWLGQQASGLSGLPIGYFGASTGAGAALVAASQRPEVVRAVVSRGGRPDLAGDALSHVSAPTLLIVGGNDVPVIGMNQRAAAQITAETQLIIVPGATHLFEEPSTLDTVAHHAQEWFLRHLALKE
jgi:putative phosphoribosyl transferase